MPPKFSVVLIAKNEEKTLPRLVKSLADFQARGGEIILVDTGSTDNTVQVATDLGCTVKAVGTRFVGMITTDQAAEMNAKFVTAGEEAVVKGADTLFDYSGARNFAASLAKNDVVAMPDCDEVYTKLDIDKINEQIASGVGQLEYNFVFSHDAEGNELIKFMHSKFYCKNQMKWVGIIHEVLDATNPNVKRQFLGEDIIKLEHFQNVETNRAHYLKGLALACHLDPQNDRNAHYFGRELMYSGRLRSAIAQLQRHAAMGKWPAERSQSIIHIGECQMILGETQEAVHSYIDAFDACPIRREPLMKIADYYDRVDSEDHVIAYVAAALQIKQGNFYANYQPYYENIPHEMMYKALLKKGEVRNSMQHFNICFAYQPFNSKYLHDFRNYYELPKISFVIPTLGRKEGLEKCVESIKKLNYPQDKIEILVIHDGEESDELLKGKPQIEVLVNTERKGVPETLKIGVDYSKGDWIVYASNDTEFTPDSLMIAFKTCMDNKKHFMAFNTQEPNGVLPDEGNICEHFMIKRTLIEKLGGEIFDTEFHHVGVDNLLWAKMKKLGHAMRCQRAVVHHAHFSKPGGVSDDVTKIAWNEERVKHDRDLLEKKLAQLNSN